MKYYVCRFCTETFKSITPKKNIKHCFGKLNEISKTEYLRLQEINEHKNN